MAAAPSDLDGDGVIDARDQCPGTPRGAAVDARGCWVVKGLRFATDSSTIDAKGKRVETFAEDREDVVLGTTVVRI